MLKTTCSQLLIRRLSLNKLDRRIIAIVALLITQLETLIQSVRELSKRSSNRSTEEIAASERSILSVLRSDKHIENSSKSTNSLYFTLCIYSMKIVDVISI